VINIAQWEDKADAHAHESSLLALSQVIELKQKTLANMMKMLEIPGISDSHKSCILDDIMKLMQVIQDKENSMEELKNRKRKAPEVVSQFLANTRTLVVTASGAVSSAVPITHQNILTNIPSSSSVAAANDAMSPCKMTLQFFY
jgi:hypothetical protein